MEGVERRGRRDTYTEGSLQVVVVTALGLTVVLARGLRGVVGAAKEEAARVRSRARVAVRRYMALSSTMDYSEKRIANIQDRESLHAAQSQESVGNE